MRPPKLVLPSGSMPWGRWVENVATSTESAIRREESNQNSIGSQFKSRAENLSKQIAGISNVISIDRRPIANFTRTGSASSDGLGGVSSPLVSLTPPRPGEPFNLSVIFEFRAQVTSGGGNLNFPRFFGRVGNTGNRVWSLDGWDRLVGTVHFSMMYTYSSSVTEPLQSQFHIVSAGITNTTVVSFTQCSITGIFMGAL